MSLYKFMGFTIGEHSYDYHTCILFRKKKDLKIRKHPNTIGVSTAVLMDLIQKGTKIIVVKIDKIPVFKTNPKTWIEKAIIDKLRDDQDPHAFLHLTDFQTIENNLEKINLRVRKQEEDASLKKFIGSY